MQTNNPDMIGFQNSLTKNSWQKPRSIVEMNIPSGHVNQGDFDREDLDRERQTRGAQREIHGIKFEKAAEEAYNYLIPQIEGRFHGFSHDPDKAYSGVETYTASNGNVIYPIDAGAHLGEYLPRGISDEATQMAHERFMDALNNHHDSQMRAQIALQQHEADQDENQTDMETDAAQKADFFKRQADGNPPLHESSWSSAMRKARSENQTPMTVETNPKSPTDIKYVDDEGFRQLGERMRGLAGRHLRTMDKEKHPSRILNDDERRHYKNILQEIEQGKHDEPLMDLVKDAMYDPEDPVHGWQYVHGYATSLIPQRISADIKDRVNSSILGGTERMSGMGKSRYYGASDRLQDNVYDAENRRIRRGDYGP